MFSKTISKEELNTDEINLDELLDNIDNQDIIDILDQDISEEEILLAVKNLNTPNLFRIFRNVFESCFDIFRS
jgi:hypothetical protein